MKVGDLIAKLEEYDENMEVEVYGEWLQQWIPDIQLFIHNGKLSIGADEDSYMYDSPESGIDYDRHYIDE